jgi:protein-disulfide isomerase
LTPWTSTPPPELAPDDHVRGEGPLVIEYGDLECPYCAKTDALLAGLPIRRVFRHFPVVSKHPRSRALAHAVEAAGLQGRFWQLHDSLYADQGRLDDPHLWARCRTLGLDLDRFESDRRSDAVGGRVERDFRSGIRAGVTTTPTLFTGGEAHPGVPGRALISLLERHRGAAGRAGRLR